MPTSARVLADSISDRDYRLITVEATFPRYLLSEFNTHRLFSRNSASSRAIPPEKQLHRILDDPFIPVEFYSRTKGMGQDAPLEDSKRSSAVYEWLRARTDAVRHALSLITSPRVVNSAIYHHGDHDGLRRVIDIVAKAIADDDVPLSWCNVSKSTVNRILEPFMWHTVIVTATEWDNFFSLRCPPGYEVDLGFPAEPEIQRLALEMRKVMRASTPNDLGPGEWHTPLVEDGYARGPSAGFESQYFWPKVSVGRCARVSFDTHENFEEEAKSTSRAEALENSGHMSPFEHVATPFTEQEWSVRRSMADQALVAEHLDETTCEQLTEQTQFCGNFRGWTQYRKFISHESDRRGFLEERAPWDHAALPEHQPAMGGDV